MRSTYLCLASLLFVVAAACGPSATGGGDDIDGGNGMCSDGARRCTGNAWESCQGGDFVVVQECADACDSSLGCVLCVPGTGTCNGDTSHACRPDGMGYFDEFCDPVMGSSCNPGSGVCDGACSANTLGQSYIGCDYYATQTSQLVNPSFQFAVAISNTSGDLATVTIDGGTFTTPVTLMVASGEVATRYLPWVPILKTCNTQGAQECGAPEQYGALAVRGAYHVRSTRPVTVYQFSPLDYAMGNTFSFQRRLAAVADQRVDRQLRGRELAGVGHRLRRDHAGPDGRDRAPERHDGDDQHARRDHRRQRRAGVHRQRAADDLAQPGRRPAADVAGR